MRQFLIGDARVEDVIPPPLQAFLDAFREKDDRIAACEAAGITWEQVQEGISTCAAFRKAWDSLWEAEKVRVEDSLRRGGKSGSHAAAKAFLAARDPAYTNRLKVEHMGNVRVSAESARLETAWLDRFLPAAPAEEPIEAEYVEVEKPN